MKRPAHYNTRQREAILGYIVSLEGEHVTAAQIVEHFKRQNVTMGRTTIYRYLDKLTASGKIRRFAADGISGACYQYAEHQENCGRHLHLKCEECKELMHLECDEFENLQRHILKEYAFQVNALKIVLYGKCSRCQNNET